MVLEIAGALGRSWDSGPNGPGCHLSSSCCPVSRRALDWPSLRAKSEPPRPPPTPTHQGGRPCARSQSRDRHPLRFAESPRHSPRPSAPRPSRHDCGPRPRPCPAQPLGQEGKPRMPAHPRNTFWGGSRPESSWRPRLGSEAQTSRSSEKKAEGKIYA